MSYNFLDKTGLAHFWEKIKAKLDTKMNVSDMTKYNYSAESAGGTIDHLASFTSGKPGLTGSISLTKKSSGIGSEIPAGWYNFFFAPHRSGVGGDNGQYGAIILTPMTFSGKSWLLRRSDSTGAITEVKQLITSAENPVLNSSFYMNTHPENSPVLIPFIHNDIAFLTYRGGSRKVYYDGVEKDININNVFDGSPTYFGVNPTTTGVAEIIIELTLHKTFTWTNTIYCDFGANGWRAKAVKIEVMNTNYSEDVWTSKLNLTANNSGNVKATFTHTPVGASNAGGGFNKVRFTFSNFNSSADFRIAQLGIYNYGSNGVRETYMSRGIDDYLFRNVTPNNNNTYNLGDSSHKWKNVYATTFNGALSGNATSATKATQDSDGNAINTTYYKASNPSGYTSNTGTVTSVAVKMNGASKGTVTTSGTIDLGTVITAHQDISGKVDKVTGKGLSTNDYTTTEKNKLAGIASGATANTGTVTSIAVKMNGSTKGTITTSGTIDLGTVITTVDDEFDSSVSATNPVQNWVISSAIDNLGEGINEAYETIPQIIYSRLNNSTISSATIDDIVNGTYGS